MDITLFATEPQRKTHDLRFDLSDRLQHFKSPQPFDILKIEGDPQSSIPFELEAILKALWVDNDLGHLIELGEGLVLFHVQIFFIIALFVIFIPP